MNRIVKNGLTLTDNGRGGFTCDDLATIPQRFADLCGAEAVQDVRDGLIAGLRAEVVACYATKEERDATPAEEAQRIGQERFDAIVDQIRASVEQLDQYSQLLFWNGYWWYYHPELMAQVAYKSRPEIVNLSIQKSTSYLTRALPESIQQSVADMTLANTVINGGHFALLFIENRGRVETRRIITDTQLFELRDIGGYEYLDITDDGQPIIRCCCRRGGERCFFDGQRLMSHDRFQTCAPKTVLIDGGYKVNSTKCTIVNGQLYELIDVDDKVAQTTGAWMGMVDFTRQQQIDAIRMAEESAAKMRVEDGKVLLDGTELKPIGVFAPAPMSLLESGFTLVGWSGFDEILTIKYPSVMVVDDRPDWIEQVSANFGQQVNTFTACLTRSAETAFDAIMRHNPAAVILDMHLTEEERFEGLWVANSLANSDFGGDVLLASSYPDEQLRAMQKLIRRPTIATGKNIERVRLALCGKLKS